MQSPSAAIFTETHPRRQRNRIGKYALQIEISCYTGDFENVSMWLDMDEFDHLWNISTEAVPGDKRDNLEREERRRRARNAQGAKGGEIVIHWLPP